MEISELNGIDEFVHMGDEWNKLIEKTKLPIMYLRHEFIHSWILTYGLKEKLHFFIGRKNGHLRAIFPLIERNYLLKKLIKVSVVSGIGQEIASISDSIISRGFERNAIESLMMYLKSERREWDTIYFRSLYPMSAWLSLAKLNAIGAFYSWKNKCGVPYLPLPNTWEELSDGLGHNTRRNLQRYQKKLRSQGVEVKIFEKSDEIYNSLDRFFSLHEMRWGMDELRKRGYENYKSYIRTLVRLFGNDGAMRMVSLVLDSSIIAAVLCFDIGTNRFLLMNARDPVYAKMHAGKMVYGEAIKDAILRGQSTCFFGSGVSDYKLLFTPYVLEPCSLSIMLSNNAKTLIFSHVQRSDEHDWSSGSFFNKMRKIVLGFN